MMADIERAMRCAVFDHAVHTVKAHVQPESQPLLNGGMDKTTLFQNLNAMGLTLPEACALIHGQTGAVLVASQIHVHFSRYERLSEPMTAAFAYFFRANRKRYRGQ